MIKFENIKINTSDIENICSKVSELENYNDACKLIGYWKERMSPKMIKELTEVDGNGLPYGFVGDGWPYKSDQTYALKFDYLKVRNAFHENNWNYRDVGDAIYQANFLIPKIIYNDRIRILDIGSGFGRLAIPFCTKLHECTYIGLDYSPIGLLTASEVVPQFIGRDKVLRWNEDGDIDKYSFISLPTWKLQNILQYKFNLFISIHTMQEMSTDTINYYLSLIDELADDAALFYSINLPPADKVELKGWKLIVDEGYPINRDGSFNQRLWIKT